MSKKIETIALQLSKKNCRKRRRGVAKLLAEPSLTATDKAELIEKANITLKDFEKYIPKPCCCSGFELNELLELLEESEGEDEEEKLL